VGFLPVAVLAEDISLAVDLVNGEPGFHGFSSLLHITKTYYLYAAISALSNPICKTSWEQDWQVVSDMLKYFGSTTHRSTSIETG
jgi:hypothetical protein